MPSGEQKAFEFPRLPPQQLSLRWRDTASVLVAPGPIDTKSYEICAIPDDTTARQFIERHHYSGEYVPARFRFGLYHRGGELQGVAVFSVPMNYHSFDRFRLDTRNEGVELARLVLLDQTGGNAESLFWPSAFVIFDVAECARSLHSRIRSHARRSMDVRCFAGMSGSSTTRSMQRIRAAPKQTR